ncbi:perlucin-like protein [Mya arenaria]|uniref:perlucin-like protein n=1 Tax=Mya arenaria TaxID=6604 RepID=UPI0022E2D97C|nr:perlucin-like protein [Mya arenaria]
MGYVHFTILLSLELLIGVKSMTEPLCGCRSDFEYKVLDRINRLEQRQDQQETAGRSRDNSIVGLQNAIQTETHTSCKDGWVAFNGSCYVFGDSNLNFISAELYCRQYGGQLVRVDSAVENAFLKAFLLKHHKQHSWVGIQDTEVEGIWKLFGTNTLAPFTDFRPGDGGDHDAEDCAVFQNSDDMLWVDVRCRFQCRPICEMPGFN